jgi:hypothetical protein
VGAVGLGDIAPSRRALPEDRDRNQQEHYGSSTRHCNSEQGPEERVAFTPLSERTLVGGLPSNRVAETWARSSTSQ